MNIQNPILRGFNPDPSIIRVGEDYYIATSTFEWFPGVQIHHSKDLVNWTLVARPLNRKSQLDMLGVPDSGGVWAPCLSFDKGTFYLVFSNVRSFQGVWKDTPNYLVTTQDILGDWSEPIFLGSSGFDGSLFHDEDAKKYYLSMLVDHRGGKLFGGIIIQEFDESQGKLIGQVQHIFEGSVLGITEGPHLYKKDGYYYLVTAEGGTEYDHAISLARAKSITGPYEIDPNNPLLTASKNPKVYFQRTGHGDLVQDKNGNWYVVCLASRPLEGIRRCTLGRETVIEELIWEEGGWPRLKNGTKLIREQIPATAEKTVEKRERVSFSSQRDLDIHFQSLRIPMTENWMSLKDRPSYLRLYGQESLSSLHRQSLIARRVQSFHIEASTALEFSPKHFQHIAGLVCYYNTYHWHYLHILGAEDGGRELRILSCDKYEVSEYLSTPIEIPKTGAIYLKVEWKKADIQFYYSMDEKKWEKVGPVLDGSILSDDYVRDDEVRYRPAFTGAFVGLCCQDLSGQKGHADFAWWDYKEKSHQK